MADDIIDCLKQYVETFVKTFEDKLSEYKKQSAPGAKPKSGKLSGDVKTVSSMTISALALVSGVSSAAGSAAGKAVEKISEKTTGKESRNKAKKINERLRSTKKDELRNMLVRAAGQIFQNFECQFMNVTDADGYHMRALEKLAEDGVDRIMNYFNEEPCDDLALEDLLVKAVLLGKSKTGLKLTNDLKLIKTGRTIKQKDNEWKTAQLYEIQGIVEKGDERYKYYCKYGDDGAAECINYRLNSHWESLHDYYVKSITKHPEYEYVLSRKQLNAELDKILKHINKMDAGTISEIVHENHEMLNEIHEKVVTEDHGKGTKLEGPIWFDVRDPVSTFTGRTKELQDLHETLQKTGETVISQMASVSGLGGVGKSELARKYVSLYNKEYCQRIIWINAESYDTLTDSFKRLASNKLNMLLKTPDGENKDIRAIVEDVYNFFSTGKCLFIFDNADKRASQEERDAGLCPFLPLFPFCAGHVFVLITSRNRKWGDLSVLGLDVFTAEESAEFIRKTLKIAEGVQEDDIAQLSVKLQRLPLALQQAVAYIKVENENNKNQGSEYNIADYLEEFDEDTKQLLDFEFPAEFGNTYTKTVFTTWRITVRKIESNKYCGDLAKGILDKMAYLAADNIPWYIFIKSEMTKNQKRVRGSALDILKQYSMINSAEDGLYNIHRLVQEVTRLELQEQNKEDQILNSLADLQTNFDNTMSVENSERCCALIPHLESFLSHLNRRVNNFAKHEQMILLVCFNLGALYTRFYDSRRGKEMLERALDILEKNPKHGLKTLEKDIMHFLVIVYELSGEYNLAKDIAERSLRIHEEYFGPDAKSLSTTLVILAKLTGDYESKIEILERALAIQEKHYGPAHVELDIWMVALVNEIIASEKDYTDKIKPLLEKIKNIENETYGRDYIPLTPIASDLEGVSEFHRLSTEFYERIIAIRTKTVGPDELMVAKMIFELAVVMQKIGNRDKEKQLLERASAIEAKHYGPNGSHLSLIECELAYILGDSKESEAKLRGFLEIQEKRYGQDHAMNLDILRYLAIVNIKSGNLEEAKRLLQRAVKIADNNPDNLNAVVLLRYLALVLMQLGEATEANAAIERTLSIQRKHLKPDHIDIGKTLFFLAVAMHELRDFERENKFYDEALEIMRRHYGRDHIMISRILYHSAGVKMRLGFHARAKQFLEEALEIQRKCLVPGHEDIAATLSLLGALNNFLEKEAGSIAGASSP